MKALELLKKRLSLCTNILIGDEYSDGLDSFEKDCKEIEDSIKEIEDLEQINKDLLNTIIEAQKVIKNVLEAKK